MLQRSSLAYISVLWLLFQLLIEINCQITPFKPRQRYAHTATLINDKLYILGGGLINDSYNVGKDFFYLDFSVKFDTAQDSLWQDLSSINTVPSHFSAASVKGGKNNNTLILYGGINSTAMELVYMYDQQSNSWSTPKLAGPRDTHLTGVTNYNGNMYLWGGVNGVKLEADIMLILDTTNFYLKSGNLTDAPVPSHNYGAVLLPNNNIIYMGGYSMGRNADLALDQIYIYDTINNKWSTQATKGTVPSARRGFSAVLGLDGQRIIIFGGTTSTTIDISITDENLKPEDSLYVLDLTNFEWSTPKIAGTIPNSRVYHRANVIGKYMVISFGNGYNQSNESDILLLDIGNNEEYIWTNKFDPKISSSLTSPKIEPQTKNDASPIMIAIMTTSLFGIMILFFGAYFLYKWNKNKQKQSKATFIIPKGEEQDDLPVIRIGKTRFSMANNIGHINNINPT